FAVGDRLPLIDTAEASRIEAIGTTLARRESAWVARLADLEPVTLPGAIARPSDGDYGSIEVATYGDREGAIADVLLALSRATHRRSFDVRFRDRVAGEVLPADIAVDQAPLRIAVAPDVTLSAARQGVLDAITKTRRMGVFAPDRAARY